MLKTARANTGVKENGKRKKKMTTLASYINDLHIWANMYSNYQNLFKLKRHYENTIIAPLPLNHVV